MFKTELIYIYIYVYVVPFNGMLIIASNALWLIYMLRNLNWTIEYFDFEFWFEQGPLKLSKCFIKYY
jgi:hypothetical protein